MSLNWSTEKCGKPEPHGDGEARERDRLIFATAAVGLAAITHDNKREWLVRLRVWQELGRGQLIGANPLGALERWVGLETNVTVETREEWTARLLTTAFERAECKAAAVLEVSA